MVVIYSACRLSLSLIYLDMLLEKMNLMLLDESIILNTTIFELVMQWLVADQLYPFNSFTRKKSLKLGIF